MESTHSATMVPLKETGSSLVLQTTPQMEASKTRQSHDSHQAQTMPRETSKGTMVA